ncbi:MAG: OmpH family outer membrane protein [Albidovulum sp.]|uniref:OmpH family outer membrane protein n=1 Tax=Albidovulum sp. TaxID=1872424 RepID=UPI003CA46CB3
MRILKTAIVALTLAVGAAAVAQEAAPSSPILTLDQEKLFLNTLWGKRATQRIEAASAELSAENRQIEAELTAEEKALTEQRATMEPAAFRVAADAFDAKVTDIRQRQDTKVRAIGQIQEAERQTFFTAAFPVIEEVVRSRGALAVLDSRAIFLAADAIDITDDLVSQIDAALGAGTDAPVSGEPEPVSQPDGEGGGGN